MKTGTPAFICWFQEKPETSFAPLYSRFGSYPKLKELRTAEDCPTLSKLIHLCGGSLCALSSSPSAIARPVAASRAVPARLAERADRAADRRAILARRWRAQGPCEIRRFRDPAACRGGRGSGPRTRLEADLWRRRFRRALPRKLRLLRMDRPARRLHERQDRLRRSPARTQTEYPAHSHEAEELYLPLAGRGWWRMQNSDWRFGSPGELIRHAPWISHAMRTADEPLLAAYVWRGGDLSAKSRIDERRPLRST